MTDPLLRRSNWWRGRSPGYFKMRSSDPDPELHYFRGYDHRDQATIWYDALRIWGIDAKIEAAEARLAARLEAEARYREQRRQALTAILYGVVIMILVIAAAGG